MKDLLPEAGRVNRSKTQSVLMPAAIYGSMSDCSERQHTVVVCDHSLNAVMLSFQLILHLLNVLSAPLWLDFTLVHVPLELPPCVDRSVKCCHIAVEHREAGLLHIMLRCDVASGCECTTFSLQSEGRRVREMQ